MNNNTCVMIILFFNLIKEIVTIIINQYMFNNRKLLDDFLKKCNDGDKFFSSFDFYFSSA